MQAPSNEAAGTDFTAALLRRLAARQATIGVVGLGYVGLPLAVGFADAGHTVIGFDVDELSYATDERIKLSATDYVIAACTTPADTTLLCITQTGKVIHRESKSIELSKSSTARGQALIPLSRLEQGVRFMGAAAVRESDSVIVLDATGRIRMLEAGAITGAGSIEAEAWILSIGLIQAENWKRRP